MFSADLSWMDDTVEKVGQRKGRKHKAREESVSSSLSKSSTDTQKQQSPALVKPSFSSVKGSFRKAPGKASSISSNERRKRIPLPLPAPETLKDPLQQPNWTLTAKLPSKLPSGAPLEPPPPFTERDVLHNPTTQPTGRILYSRQTNITREASKWYQAYNKQDANSFQYLLLSTTLPIVRGRSEIRQKRIEYAILMSR